MNMKNFTMVDNDILEANISDGAVRLYIMLSSYCFGDKSTCFPSQNTLAIRLNKSVRTIQRYLGELISNGLIIKKRRGSISNEYQLVMKAGKNAVSKVKEFFARKSKTREDAVFETEFKQTSKPSSKAATFSAYPQRTYAFEKLENMLLGRDENLPYEDCLL
jgi:predicted transcriptional regulator